MKFESPNQGSVDVCNNIRYGTDEMRWDNDGGFKDEPDEDRILTFQLLFLF